MFNKFLILFAVTYALILFYAPKELPRETLNVSIEGETVRHYQRAQGECSRTKHTIEDILRGLNAQHVKITCIKALEIIQQ